MAGNKIIIFNVNQSVPESFVTQTLQHLVPDAVIHNVQRLETNPTLHTAHYVYTFQSPSTGFLPSLPPICLVFLSFLAEIIVSKQTIQIADASYQVNYYPEQEIKPKQSIIVTGFDGNADGLRQQFSKFGTIVGLTADARTNGSFFVFF